MLSKGLVSSFNNTFKHISKHVYPKRFYSSLPESLLLYDPSPDFLIETMLEEVNLQPNQTYLDFGCGDGRWVVIAAKQFKAKSIGIEIVPERAQQARDAIKSAKLNDLAEILEVDGFGFPLNDVDVISVYYTDEGMSILIPKLLREMKKGSKVISVKIPIREWKPTKVKKMYEFKVYVYTMPPELL